MRNNKEKLRDREARSYAMAHGHKTYETGIPCVNGHVDFRYTASGACRTCLVEQTRRRRAKLRAEGKIESTRKTAEEREADKANRLNAMISKIMG